MSHAEHRLEKISDPGSLKSLGDVSEQHLVIGVANKTGVRSMGFLYGVSLALVIMGLLAFGFQLLVDPQMAMASYLEGYFFVMCLSLSGAFFVALNNVTKSVWSQPLRRIAECMASFMPYNIFLLLPILAAVFVLYPWAEVGHDGLHGSKATWLSPAFWALRVLSYVIIWYLFTRVFIKRSLAQDKTGTALNHVGLSAAFLIVFAFTFSLFCFDALMSLKPHWWSTMYGVYCFAGLFQSGMALIILFALFLRRGGYLSEVFKDRHLFDIGTWLLAWCTFMCYIGFSQFMLIYYPNLPEEVIYYTDHLKGGFKWLYIGVFLVKWAIPFFLLMPKPSRRSPLVLTIMCVALLLAQWCDIYWLIAPEFYLNEAIYPPVLQNGLISYPIHYAFNMHFVFAIFVGLGFLGAFLLKCFNFFASHSVIAVGEPKLLESANGDYL